MRALKHLAAAASLATLSVVCRSAAASEPWSDPDPPKPPERLEVGNLGLRGGAEYRANWLYVNPLSLNTPTERRLNWIEHRLRLDATVDYIDKVRLIASADLLDGVLWGDNGNFGENPSPDRGSNVNARNPNVTAPCVRLVGNRDPLSKDSYGYGLCQGDQFRLRRVYGEAVLPIGLLRVGRQPVSIGNSIQGVSADGRANRFGFARQGNNADRIMFATKPLEAFKPKEERNLSANEGFFIVGAYDKIVGDSPQLFGDDVHQTIAAVRLALPRLGPLTDFDFLQFWTHRWDRQYSTNVDVFGTRLLMRMGGFGFGGEWAMNLGTTREVGEAYKVITNDPALDQPVRQYAGRAVLRYDYMPTAAGPVAETASPASQTTTPLPIWTAYLEFDYASGDSDPQNTDPKDGTKGNPLTQFVWAEDNNVGLLLFKHVLAFQSARSAAAAVETLRQLGAKSFPAESINTRGAFANAIAIFPQADIRPHPTLLLRGGVLFAWSAVRSLDPVASLLARDGVSIEDDLKNFAGGKPGNYYGTEIDGRVSWRYLDHFIFDLEGALLFPGNALYNVDGRAARSGMVQGRTTFVF